MSELNQENDPPKEEPVADALLDTELPGRRLREQRETSRLSIEEVAHHLRLDAQLIKSLESDDYGHLPSPAYICGYLRSYARLLKLPEDEIVRAYTHGEHIDAALIPQSVNIQPRKAMNTAFIKWLVILVVIILLFGSVYLAVEKFLVFSRHNEQKLGSEKQKSTELIVPIAPKPKQTELTKTTKAIKKQSDLPAKKMADVPQVPVLKSVNQPTKTVIEKLPTSKNKIPQNEAIKNTGVPQIQTGTAASQVTASAQNSQNIQNAQGTTLHLHFDNASWVEVTDSNGKRLVYRLVAKNTDLNLNGQPPYTVLLGNASGVKVYYEGKEFDHSGYQRNHVAYFRVGS